MIEVRRYEDHKNVRKNKEKEIIRKDKEFDYNETITESKKEKKTTNKERQAVKREHEKGK